MATLQVSRSDLRKALKLLKKWTTPQEGEEAVLTWADDALTIAITGMEASLSASGDWPGEARVPARYLLGVGQYLAVDPVVVTVADGILAIGSSRIQCVWQESGWHVPVLPRNPTDRDLLMLKVEAFPREIERSGLAEPVKQAEEERDRRIRAATAQLSQFGVTEADVRALVESCFLRSE